MIRKESGLSLIEVMIGVLFFRLFLFLYITITTGAQSNII